MGIRVPRRSTIALATAGALASTGTAYLGARNLLVGQATHARTVIPKSFAPPPQADGVYGRGGGPVQRWRRGTPFDLHLMMFGDSTACGYGCTAAEEVPGVVIARNLAEQTGKRVRLSTKAIVGATSKGVCGQVDAMFVAGPPPDAAVIIIGANDITSLNGIGPSAERLASVVRKLRARGAVVVVGTCPDFGVITAIPQPLRSLAHTRGAQLARAQSIAVKAAGGTPVPLANLLASRLRSEPERMLSDDRYHPSAAAYALAADHLLLALRDALRAKAHQNGCRQEGSPTAPLPAPPEAPSPGAGQARGNIVSRLWRRPASGLPAAVPMPAVG